MRDMHGTYQIKVQHRKHGPCSMKSQLYAFDYSTFEDYALLSSTTPLPPRRHIRSALQDLFTGSDQIGGFIWKDSQVETARKEKEREKKKEKIPFALIHPSQTHYCRSSRESRTLVPMSNHGSDL